MIFIKFGANDNQEINALVKTILLDYDNDRLTDKPDIFALLKRKAVETIAGAGCNFRSVQKDSLTAMLCPSAQVVSFAIFSCLLPDHQSCISGKIPLERC